MAHTEDRDGKLDTASAADPDHYPKTTNGENHHDDFGLPSQAEIAQRAHQLWIEQGCPQGAAQQNWLDAERELHTAALSRRTAHEKSGSIKN
jgi:hypothetical protein